MPILAHACAEVQHAAPAPIGQIADALGEQPIGEDMRGRKPVGGAAKNRHQALLAK